MKRVTLLDWNDPHPQNVHVKGDLPTWGSVRLCSLSTLKGCLQELIKWSFCSKPEEHHTKQTCIQTITNLKRQTHPISITNLTHQHWFRPTKKELPKARWTSRPHWIPESTRRTTSFSSRQDLPNVRKTLLPTTWHSAAPDVGRWWCLGLAREHNLLSLGLSLGRFDAQRATKGNYCKWWPTLFFS